MKVELLYFDGCPNWRETDQRLRQALQLVGRDDVLVERIQVSTPEEAQAIGFLGSPTVRINGADPFAEPGARVGLACRLFQTSAGLAGAPTVEQLIEVVRTAEASRPREPGQLEGRTAEAERPSDAKIPCGIFASHGEPEGL